MPYKTPFYFFCGAFKGDHITPKKDVAKWKIDNQKYDIYGQDKPIGNEKPISKGKPALFNQILIAIKESFIFEVVS